MLKLPNRPQKPRKIGITSISDTGIPIAQLEGILNDYADFIDIAKLGVGSAYVTPNLDEKIALYRSHDIAVYFGGTLFEKFMHGPGLDAYLKYLNQHKIHHIEISTGTIDIPIEERVEMTRKLSSDFVVLGEVGSKDQDTIMPPSEWIQEINWLIEAGATYVITEGRDSGTAGIYRPSGELRTGLVTDILKSCEGDKIIFEAPAPKLQMFFINSVGPNVNLGNVKPTEVLLLEAQRQSLRNETFFLNHD